MSYIRRIKVGKQTYLCCNIKSGPCEEENGCVQCNEKHWPAIEKILHPLLLQCSSDLEDKDTRVEFYGSAPCTIDDLYMKINYELKPRNNLSFVVVQPRSDDKIWESAWSNISHERSNYNNFGGFFEHVRFLNYILQVNINKTDELCNASSSGCDNQRDNEEKSSYFQENMNCKSNPLGVMLKRKHEPKKSKTVVKCYNKLLKETENNTNFVESANSLITPRTSKSVATPSTDVMSHRTFRVGKQETNKDEVGIRTLKPNFKQSPVMPKKKSSCLFDSHSRIITEERTYCMQKNLPNNFSEKLSSDSEATNVSSNRPTEVNNSKNRRINGLLEANPIKDNAVNIKSNVIIKSQSLEDENRFPHYKNVTQELLHKDDVEIQLTPLVEAKRERAICTYSNISEIFKKEIISDSSLNDSNSSKNPTWLNKKKNVHNKKLLSQTSVIKNSDKKRHPSVKTMCTKGKKIEGHLSVKATWAKGKKIEKSCTVINTKHSPGKDKEKINEKSRNTFNFRHTISRIIRELPPEDSLQTENGYYNEEDMNITLPNLDEPIGAYSDIKTLEQGSINETKRSDKPNLYPKRKCSPVSSQRSKKKLFSVDRPKFQSSSSNEHSAANSVKKVKKDDTTGQMSRLRKVFLDIVSRKKISDTKEFSDIAFLQTDVSPLKNNKRVNEVIDLNAEDVQRMKHARLVSSLTKPELRYIFGKHLDKLKDISCRKTYCRRHEDFVRGGRASYELTYQVNLSPFKQEQLDYVMELLMSEFYVKPNEDIDYVLKVLLPEALIIIFMEFHGTDYENSDRLMAEAAFNAENAEVL